MTEPTPTKPKAEKKRPPRFLLAMPDDVRIGIERAAYMHSRTVTAEINMRLKASLQADAPQATPTAAYSTAHKATVLHTNEKGPDGALSNTDQAMLEIFRRLPPEKQLALLSLLN